MPFNVIIVCIGAGEGTEKAVVLGAVPRDTLPVVPRNKLTEGVDDDCLLPRFVAALKSEMVIKLTEKDDD